MNQILRKNFKKQEVKRTCFHLKMDCNSKREAIIAKKTSLIIIRDQIEMILKARDEIFRIKLKEEV